MRRVYIAILLLALVLVIPAGADEPPAPAAAPQASPVPPPAPLTVEQAADAVLAAVQAKDDAALKALAEKDAPDPWLVADELLGRREAVAAEAFAKAAPRKDTERLPEYLTKHRNAPPDAAVRAALAAANAALARGEGEAALAGLRGIAVGPDSVTGVLRKHGEGLALRLLRRLEESASVLLATADAAEALGWWSRTASALYASGLCSAQRSDFRGSLACWSRRLVVEESREDRAEVATSLGNIGVIYDSLGDYPKALSYQERALEVMDALGDRAGVAVGLGNIGNIYGKLGDYPRALSYQERALAMKEALGDRAEVATTLGNIGLIHDLLGDYPRALSYQERALAMKEALGNRAGVARTLANIGNIHDALGDYPKALSYHERVLEMMEALGDRAVVARTLGNIGNIHDALGDYPKALSYYERALELFDALGDRAGVAATLGNIGSIHRLLGDYPKALSYQERSLEMEEALGDRAGVATTLGNIGIVHHSLGDYLKALSYHERALATKEALGRRAGVARTLGSIGNIYQLLGDYPKALLAARRGVEASARLVEQLAEEEEARAREQYASAFDVGLRASVALGAVSDLAWFLEQGRAGSLRAGLGSRAALEAATIPTGLREGLLLARATEHRTLEAWRKASDTRELRAIRETRKAWEEAQAAVGEAEARIQREARAAASLTLGEVDDLEDLRSYLAPDEALVVYGLTAADSVALVIRRDGARMVSLGASAAIETAARAMLDDEERHVVPEAAAGLRDLVVAPLGLGEDVKRVLVSPAGLLGYIPFALLLPEREVVYVPSGTTYGLLLADRARRGEGVLALGDPDYRTLVDETAWAVRSRGGVALKLRRLDATRAEVDAVGTTRFLGEEASESGLQEAVSKSARWRAVHFACHGLIDPERPMFSSLALTADAANDGFLTALEIFRLKVPADLVVMSACETGKGRIYKTEGIVGLTRAFMFAGAPRVICSLWKVDDEATMALMVKFYELWNPKEGSKELGAAEALRQAQDYIRSQDKWKHPYYWAAWVLWGLP